MKSFQKIRKKPVVVEGFQFNMEEAVTLMEPKNNGYELNINGVLLTLNIAKQKFIIKTLEGNHEVSDGDWIIKGISGEHYPCKPDIKEKTYDNLAETKKNNGD